MQFYSLLFLLTHLYLIIFFFFFQAEDGIRDGTVTGVQTCALPICSCALLVVFLELGHQCFGGEHEAGDGRGVLQREASDLGRVNDASLDEANVFTGVRVEAEVIILGLADFADDHGAFEAGVEGDLTARLFERALYDANTHRFVVVQLQLVDCVQAAQQRRAAAGNDAFLDSRAGCVHGVLNTSLLFLQLGFGRSTNLDDGNATDEFRQAFLELLAVVVGGGVFHLEADLLDAAFDFAGFAAAFDDGGVVLVDGELLGFAQVLDLDVLELDAEVFGDGLTAGQNRDVLEHGLAAIAKARGLDGGALQGAAQLVHHEGGEGFAFDILRNDEERLAELGNLLEQGKQVLHRADLLFVDEDQGVFEDNFLAIHVGDEVGGEVAAVELHAFDDFERGVHGLGLFHGDDAVLADLLHRFSDDAADLPVVVGGNGANLGDHVALDVSVELLDFLDGDFDGLVDAALKGSGAGAGGNRLHAFAEDGLGQNGGGGGAVTRDVAGLAGDFANHLRAHVLEGIAGFDFLGNGHAVFGDDGRAELLFDHRISALGAEGDLYCVREGIHAA